MEKRIFENPIIKDRVQILKSTTETSGEYLLLEIELAPGGGNGLHYHTSFAEEFIPVDGELGIQLEEKNIILTPGQKSTAQAHQLHRFYNPGKKPIRFHVRVAPAQEGFLKALSIGYGLAGDGLTNKKGIPKKLDHLALVLELSETRFKGVLGLVTPLLLKRAKRARKKGVYDALVEKYYQQ